MICKTAVARKVLANAWSRNLQIKSSAIYLIDAAEHFGASVDACLMVCILKRDAVSRECVVYSYLEASRAPTRHSALRAGRLVSDLGAFNTYGHLFGTSPLKWRSGVKHDCSKVIELYPRGCGYFENRLGEIVSPRADPPVSNAQKFRTNEATSEPVPLYARHSEVGRRRHFTDQT